MKKLTNLLMIGGLCLTFIGCSSMRNPFQSSAPSAVTTDNSIQDNLAAKLSNQDNFPKSNIYVDAFRGTVLLTGQVQDQAQKDFMLNVTRGYPGVTKIYDFTEIRLPVSYSVRSNDSFITSNVKAQLLGTNGIPSNSIKVETTNGIVYMLGSVTKAQGESAAQMTALVGGVQKVVTLFQYIQ